MHAYLYSSLSITSLVVSLQILIDVSMGASILFPFLQVNTELSCCEDGKEKKKKMQKKEMEEREGV